MKPLFTRPAPELDRRRARAVAHDDARRGSARDVHRPRATLLAALIGAIVAAIAWAVAAPPAVSREAAERAPGPLGRPHVDAKVACAGCHGRPEGAARACTHCHGAHASTRAGHRAAAARGELACVDCHVAHGDAQGVTFDGVGGFLRWGGSTVVSGQSSFAHVPRASVPLVAARACGRCHDLARPTDAIAACLSREDGARTVLCFDEHPHAPHRWALADAAREAAHEVPWVTPAPPSGRAPWTWLGAALAAAMLAFAGSAMLARRRGPPGAPSALANTPTARVRLPTIDASRCLGCNACVDACPLDVLAIDRFVAVVARPDDCCGAAVCADVCPNGSLRLEEGAPADDRPRVTDRLESADAPGVFLAGDLTGMPLIKNAIAQGARAADAAADSLRGARRDGDVDLVVIGAGPAGLSAALRAKERGLSCVVLEQASVAASIQSFPRHKLVFDPPLDVPVEGPLWLQQSTKEELLAQWTRLVRKHAVDVRERHRVVGIDRRDGGGFVVLAEGPDGARKVRAARVVLAIGRRGTPRTLDAIVAPAAAGKVHYALADARSFSGMHVLVVGLGDSALEAVSALARQPGTRVTVSYRGKGFARGKARNVADVQALALSGRVRVVFESAVVRVEASHVVLRTAGGEERVDADAVVAMLGGTPSWDLLEKAGVRRGSARSAA